MEVNHYVATETFLKQEFDWLEQIIRMRIETYFKTNDKKQSIYDIKPPIIGDESTYERFLLHYELGFTERVIVSMITASILKPEVFDLLHTQNEVTGTAYVEFGGKIDDRRFIPTYRTAAFILNESKNALPAFLFPLFEQSHPFTNFSLLDFSNAPFRTRLETTMRFNTDAEYLLFTGNAYQPEFNNEFPSKLMTTELNWEDLVLPESIKNDIDEILMWFKLENKIEENPQLNKWLKKGYRVLFYGPSGTGKRLTASLLGKYVNKPVYSVDLSMVVSKYIGETEKNLAKVFDRAQNNGWILFFDEADALFGKRTKTTSSNDRYTNQEIAYLLQRIEDFPGMIIIATNLENNLGEAFSCRFQLQVPFKLPNKEERYKLWKQIFSKEFTLEDEFILQLAENYELSGGSIVNVLRTVVLHSQHNSKSKISEEAVIYAIQKNWRKRASLD
ncbi:ATP-binding protein [uncultured Algibacter sp.]|uniref:ATP-binding protein n=1 Tax=uncultured Algibacter sp. TaxID=298659 RepID=UPI0030EF7350|tara:strand:+ start:8040 stop:9377 length:1338 start_codon:yes stop_codon:yes gene_type:complete